ncbi:hypothetical protein PFISCL1PPCAC_15499 [Pristionchus fissidentatus]|uniref:RNA helicase n=1 Tax=Pristionchus fissidentatus TaxID=1538716 RepID=A0AAV5VX50_9BILA|nr:hypothetical protein PFISCL1PPCAC_15499 [Pristionchus fissidentatus]
MNEMTTTPDEVLFTEIVEVNEMERTSDVYSDGSFKSLLLSQSTLDNLLKHGFKKPSPVQVKAIPPGISGLDMLVQAKSGTGKTLVFAILAAENLKLSSKAVQKLVVAPTREIALQIGETIQKLAPRGTRIAVLTGGTSVYDDKEKLKKGVHVVVGTTGRLCQLSSEKSLNLGSLTLFVLDEADKMMSATFERDVNYLYSCVPSVRQVAVFSATYPPHLASSLTRFLRSAIHIRLNAEDVQLVGIKQYACFCMGFDPMYAAVSIFSSIQFKQAFLFCNKSEDCVRVANGLVEAGIEAAGISSQLEQSERADIVKRLKAHKIKVLVSTDLTSRGLDADNAELVINMDVPFEVETYLHRIGRAARYGGQGASLTLLCGKKDVSRFASFAREGGIRAKMAHIYSLPPTLTTDRDFFYTSPLFVSEISYPMMESRVGQEVASFEKGRGGGAENEDPIKNISSLNSEEGSNELSLDYSALLDKAVNLSSSMKKTPVLTEKEDDARSREIAKTIKKFKFIPSRAKKSTKYYMKGEMISIRDACSSHQWNQYASKKYDMTEDPFVKSVENEYEKSDGKKKGGKCELIASTSPTTSLSLHVIKEYSRKDMIALSKSKPGKVWQSYAETMWNLEEDPFVTEQWMRCSFTERIRQERKRDKEARSRVVAERNGSRIRLLAMGTISSRFLSWQGSFEEYCCEMKKTINEEKGKTKRGPIVSKRRCAEEYRIQVEQTGRMMRQVEMRYEHMLKIALGRVKEGEVQSEERDERMAIKEEKEVDDEDEWCNTGEEGEGEDRRGQHETAMAGDENYNENEDGEGDEHVQFSLYSSFNKNIEFARVFNAYLYSMSSYL